MGTLKMRDMKMQDCRLLKGVENARLENVTQKYRAGKCKNGKSGNR